MFCKYRHQYNILFVFISVHKGEQYGDEFGKVSIIRKVPVLKDGDFILTERYVVTLIFNI